MKQETFTDMEYSFRRKKSSRRKFWRSWTRLFLGMGGEVGAIEPCYPKGKRDHPAHVLVHAIAVTVANEHDITQVVSLICNADEVVYGDFGHGGIDKHPKVIGNQHLPSIDYRINRRPGRLPKAPDNAVDWGQYIENRKASVRWKVEYTFRIMKCQFGFRETVYRGLKENENRLYAVLVCANSYTLESCARQMMGMLYL